MQIAGASKNIYLIVPLIVGTLLCSIIYCINRDVSIETVARSNISENELSTVSTSNTSELQKYDSNSYSVLNGPNNPQLRWQRKPIKRSNSPIGIFKDLVYFADYAEYFALNYDGLLKIAKPLPTTYASSGTFDDNGNVYIEYFDKCLLASYDTETNMRWEVPISSIQYSHINVIGNYVFVSEMDAFVCYNLNGILKWRSHLGSCSDISASSSGDLFFAICHDIKSDRVVCLNVDGNPLWNIRQDDIEDIASNMNNALEVFEQQQLNDGAMEVANKPRSFGGTNYNPAHFYCAPIVVNDNAMYIIESWGVITYANFDGKIAWIRNVIEDEIEIQPCLTPLNNLIVTDTYANLVCINTDGNIEWHRNLSSPISSNLIIDARGWIYFIDEASVLRAFSDQGKSMWALELKDGDYKWLLMPEDRTLLAWNWENVLSMITE